MAAGTSHTLAVKTDGTVWAWGLNDKGQLGDGTTTTRLSPVQVGSYYVTVSVSAGETHSLALDTDLLWAWGDNKYGQIGDGRGMYQYLPSLIRP